MIAAAPVARNHRVLIIDDNRAIQDDFRKILSDQDPVRAAEARLFGTPAAVSFQMDFAGQGQEGLHLVEQALAAGSPYSMAFVDVRMPPGWDGIETTRRIWEVDPDLQIVICTAYSDYSWDELGDVLGQPDRLLILKKPFDTIEVVQLAHALTDKWRLLQESKRTVATLEQAVAERTAELASSNGTLRLEIKQRGVIEAMLRETQEKLEERYRFLAEAMPQMVWTATWIILTSAGTTTPVCRSSKPGIGAGRRCCTRRICRTASRAGPSPSPRAATTRTNIASSVPRTGCIDGNWGAPFPCATIRG